MHFEDRRPDASEERILPLINVVFLLLIFFMIAGSLSAADPFAVEPPQSSRHAEVDAQDLQILIDAEGRLALDGEPLAETAMLAQINNHLADEPRRGIRLKADARIEANRLVILLEKLQQAGVSNLYLQTIEDEG